jgi:iron transport multicopper oxidase
MTTGDAANQSLTYGLNANAMVLGYNQVIEVVINNFDNGYHPIHIHGHNVQLGRSNLPRSSIFITDISEQ